VKTLLAGPQPYQPYEAKVTKYQLPLFPTPMSPSGRYTNKLSRVSLSFCTKYKSKSHLQSPDPDFPFTRFSQKLGQNVLGYQGCWIV